MNTKYVHENVDIKLILVELSYILFLELTPFTPQRGRMRFVS